VVATVRHEVRISAPNPRGLLHQGDILVIEVAPESLPAVLSTLGLHLEEDVPQGTAEQQVDEEAESAPATKKEAVQDAAPEQEKDKTRAEESVIQELVVMPDSVLANRSATDIELRTRFGINLLVISRQGRRSIKRLRSTPIRAGDLDPGAGLFSFWRLLAFGSRP